MKKVAVGLLVAFLCSFSFAGTQYIKYACGCTEDAGYINGRDKVINSSSKCADCSRKETKKEVCTQFYGEGTAEKYLEVCTD